MNPETMTAVFGISGIIVGAVLQYLLNQRIENAKHIQIIRTQAYTDFVKAVASLARQKPDNPQSSPELLTALIDAKVRVSIYGSADVIRCLNRFFQSGGVLDTDESIQLFSESIEAMRRENYNSNLDLSTDEIKVMLFG